jgi:predicted ArsR family transcriptional regulator
MTPRTSALGPLPAEPAPRVVPASVGRAALAVLHAVEANGPVTLAGLAATTGSHENTLREHLRVLLDAGAVGRSPGPAQGRGRPPWLYSAVPARNGPVAEYAGLARTLAGVLSRTSPNPSEDAHAAGVEWGHELARAVDAGGTGARADALDDAGDDAGARRRVVAMLDEMGFAPETGPDHRSVRLPRCPLLDAARAYPDVVCAVHLGIARGALREYGGDDSGVALLPFSEPGACRLHLAP